MSFTCPCCGYAGLDVSPYRLLIRLPVPEEVRPPYEIHFGDPSYEVCACCGFEFGNDDNPGTADPVSFSEYLSEWIEDGANWFNPSKEPANWSLDQQLAQAGLSQ